MSTKIEWAEETWNPVIGCSKVSPGCDNCYAARMAARLASMSMKHNAYTFAVKWRNAKPIPEWTGQAQFIESALEKPLKWKKPRRIFVCSMGDMFHESVPFEWIMQVWEIMSMSPQHTFLVLTKRPERVLQFFKYVDNHLKDVGFDSMPPDSKNPFQYLDILKNVWIGVTAENQEQADKRIPILLNIPASKRFVSIEPMLGPVDLDKYFFKDYISYSGRIGQYFASPRPDWVIAGGESGPGARPMHPDWVRSVRDQCHDANVPFLFKQWGEYLLFEETAQPPFYQLPTTNQWFDGHGIEFYNPITGQPGKWDGYQFIEDLETAQDGMFCKFGKKKAGRKLDGKIYNEYPK